MRKSRFLITLSLLLPLAACGGGEYVHPLDELKQRVVHAGRTGNDLNAEVQATLKCAAGMKPAPGSHRADIRNDTHFEYREQSPGNRSGYSDRGRIYGSYSTHSSQDVEVEAETNTYSSGRLTCVPIINLTAE